MCAGPSGLPLLGNLLDLNNRSKRHKNILKWANEWGVFKVTLMGQPALVVADPAAAVQVLITSEKLLPKEAKLNQSLSEVSLHAMLAFPSLQAQ